MRFLLVNTINSEPIATFDLIEYIMNTLHGKLVEKHVDTLDIPKLKELHLGIQLQQDTVRCEIVNWLKSSEKAIFKVDNKHAEFNRRYERVEIDQKFKAKIAPKYNEIEIIGKNISFGGMRITSQYEMNQGDYLTIAIETKCTEFYFEAEVVYKSESADGRGYWSYGLKFTEKRLRQTQSDALYDFILSNIRKNQRSGTVNRSWM